MSSTLRAFIERHISARISGPETLTAADVRNGPARARTNSVLTISSVIFVVALLSIALLIGGDVASVQAQTVDTPTPVPTAEHPPNGSDNEDIPSIEGKSNRPRYRNLDSNLNRLVEQVQTGQLTAQVVAANAPIHRGESVAVTLHITEGYAQDVWDWLEMSGASPRNSGSDHIEAYVPVSLLPAASEREGVVSIRTILPPMPAQGTVVSEGVGLHGAAAWHDAGYKGESIRIGIIDVGFQGFQSLMGTELPSTVEARCYTGVGVFTSSADDCENGVKHGTAVAEAAFDIAPGATYYIANPWSRGDLLSTVNWMVSEEVDVINHSVVWGWEGPGDGTSPYHWGALKSVDTAVTGGITWTNAAGNEARATWFGDFTDANNDNMHEFSGTYDCNIVQLLDGYRYIFQLRWDDTWGGAGKDLDFRLHQGSSSSSTTLVADSEDGQSGGSADVPFEFIVYTPPSSGTHCLAVEKNSGATPDWIQMQVSSGPSGDLQYHTLSGSIGNPAESANSGMLAVGAAPASSTSTIESYSSRGPAPDGRVKPDVVGVDKANSKTWGRWSGTSQASPHVAGLAALVKQRFPSYTPQQIAQYLKTNAEERGAAGADNIWGDGFARLAAAYSQPGRVTGLTATATHDTVSLSWDAPSVGATVTGYKILRRVVGSEQNFQTMSENTGDTNTTWTDSDVSARTRYAYRVRALGENGEGDVSTHATVLTDFVPLPGRVTGLTATATHDTVSLSWDAPSDGATVTGYKVLRRAVDSEQDFRALSENTGDTGTTWTDSDVSARTRYAYRVRALGENGEGDLSTHVTVVTDFVPLPGRVTGLTATATHDTVSLSWNAPSDGATVTGYKILRRAVGSEQNFRALSENTSDTNTTWTDSDVSARTRYAYRVRALGENGEGDVSTHATVITDFAPPNSPATGAPTITGTAQVGETLTAGTSGISDADGMDNATFGYQWLAAAADISGATGDTYTLTGADEGKAVKVRVSFTDDAGNAESLTSAATAAVAAAEPPDVTGVAVTSTPASGDTYSLGETVRVSLTFNEAVDVTGTPRLKIKMDPDYGEKWATYESGSGTAKLVFAFTVVQPNISTRGIAVLADTLALNGGTISSVATEADADLSHDGLAHDSNHKVDWRLVRLK